MKTTPIAARLFVLFSLVAAIAVVIVCADGGFANHSNWYLLLMCTLASAASTALPVTVIHAGSRAQFSATAMVLVASDLMLPFQLATLTLVVGAASALVILMRSRLWVCVEDASNYAVSAFIALVVAHLVGPSGLTPRSVAGAAVAGLIFDPLSLLSLTAANVLRKRVTFWPFFSTGIVSTAPLVPWLLSIGILLGAIGVAVPWALPLTAAPLALVFLASRARVAATEDRARLDGLLGAATTILAASSASAVTQATTASAQALFEHEVSRIDASRGGTGELSTPLITERFGTQYLTVARSRRVYAYSDQDQRLLETLASIAASALDKAALHEDVAEQATTDALTGLVNRRSFEEHVRITLGGMRGSDGVGIIFVDLDRFKEINDVHGHLAGDEVLVEAAHRLSSAVRDGDVVARLGGDEFTILLRSVRAPGDAVAVAERVLSLMRQPIVLSDATQVSTTPSVGIALALQDDRDPAQLLKNADTAMYEAKRAGKDCWRLASTGIKVA
jgi:diguanylate cyclase (GGDEF)-like protein